MIYYSKAWTIKVRISEEAEASWFKTGGKERIRSSFYISNAPTVYTIPLPTQHFPTYTNLFSSH